MYIFPGIDLTCFLTDFNDVSVKQLCCPCCVLKKKLVVNIECAANAERTFKRQAPQRSDYEVSICAEMHCEDSMSLAAPITMYLRGFR